MMVIDTNRYRDFCEGVPEVVARFRQFDRIYVPFVVLAELRAGFACGSRARENEGVFNRFLNRYRIHLLFPDEQTAFHYAGLLRQLREQGTPIPTHDLWIAALVEQHNLMLYSRDKHFDHLPQLAQLK
jgi:tRNA(fMet)-specific endonuclease VapC